MANNKHSGEIALWAHLGLTDVEVAQLERAEPNVCAQLRQLELNRVGSEKHKPLPERSFTLAVQAAPVLRCPALMALLDGHRAVLNQLATKGLPPR